MSEPKPFASVGIGPSGTFRINYHGPEGDLPSLFLCADRGQAEAEAHWLNEAVAIRERVAAASELRHQAKRIRATTRSDSACWTIAANLELRADAIESGETEAAR